MKGAHPSQVNAEQLPLFPQGVARRQEDPPPIYYAPLTPASSIGAAMSVFSDHMRRSGFSDHTVKAFIADLRLLGKHSGLNLSVGRLGNRDLNDFLTWMVEHRGVPCSPKSYGRRVTTLKVFFGWLCETAVLRHDPAAAIPHNRVTTTLPRFLSDDQVDLLLRATYDWMMADARPHLLVSLLLETGIKKGECVAISLDDIDRSDPHAPVLFIRHQNPRYRHKERNLPLPAALVPALDQYLAAYVPRKRLFECTARNLEYVLAEASRRSGLPMTVSFEMLRWTCAVRDFRSRMDERRLRDKLGLSHISWRETVEKLRALAGPAFQGTHMDTALGQK